MTSEVAILNKHAISLAADSAVTLGSSQKIYNSADKLFALSKFEPVGIMVYGSASFLGVPWEVLIKYYRQNILGEKTFPRLQDYSAHFIEFLLTTKHIASESEEQFVVSCLQVAINSILDELEKRGGSSYESGNRLSQEDTARVLIEVIDDDFEHVSALEFLPGGNKRKAKQVERDYFDLLNELMADAFAKIPISDAAKAKVRQIASLSVYKDRFSTAMTGVVVAGYGTEEIFPAVISHDMDGRIDGFLKTRNNEGLSAAITIDNSSAIIPFAQAEMVHTFMNGIHPDYADILEILLDDILGELPSIIARQLSVDPKKSKAQIAHVADKLAQLGINLRDELAQFSTVQFIHPILDTVAALPKDELAEMAEALVNLTSFRRRVTPDAETVGGPVDVLVISKGDGLVWIKRKHYFEGNLNHQYFSNYFRGVNNGKDCC